MSQPTKQLVFATISDTVGRFLYYDRKEDDELPNGAIEEMLSNGQITFDEIVEAFRKELARGLRLKNEERAG